MFLIQLGKRWLVLLVVIFLVGATMVYSDDKVLTPKTPPKKERSPEKPNLMAPKLTEGDLVEKITQVVGPFVKDEWAVGAVVAVVRPEGTTIRGFGKARSGQSNAPDENTLFEIGSVSKTFTAVLLADLVREKKVRLDEPIANLLPKSVTIPKGKDRAITLQDIATHFSGLPRMPNNFAPKDPRNPYADYDEDRLFRFLAGHRLAHQPGARFEYSNLAMGLLGVALAKRTEKTFEQLLQERILKPLQMESTAIALTPALRGRLAEGFTADAQPSANWDIPTLAGAGGIRSTARDMARYVSAHLGKGPNHLVNACGTTHTQRAKVGPNTGIGLAWFRQSERDILFHNGMTGGYASYCGLDTKNRIGVIVLTNTAGGTADRIGFWLQDFLRGANPAPIAPTPTVAVDAKLLADYAGQYFLPPLATFSVTVEDGKLMAQLTGQEKFRLYPQSSSKFYYRSVDAKVDFERNDKQQISRAVLFQNGREMPMVRMPSFQTPSPSPKSAAAASPSQPVGKPAAFGKDQSPPKPTKAPKNKATPSAKTTTNSP